MAGRLMTTTFTAKMKLIFLVAVFITITTGMCMYIIWSYQRQLQRYDRLIELITKANHILVSSQQIIDKEFYTVLSDLENDSTKLAFVDRLQTIQKDLMSLKDQATLGKEPVFLETVSRMVDSFIDESKKASDDNVSMKEKLIAYGNANSMYPLISKNLSEFISMQIKNREKLVKDLEASTDWIRLFCIGLVGLILLASLMFSIYIIGSISASMHADKRLISKLQDALDRIKTLNGLIPICSSCKKIRDDKGYWNKLEKYIQEHSNAEFSHGICPDCMKKLYPWYHPPS
jgi:hypothetical protein